MSLPLHDIPIVINNFENLHTLKPMVAQLQAYGYTNVIVLDNQSSYPPLLEYYQTCPCRVMRLNANRGHLALFQCPLLQEVLSGWFIYTDPDLEVSTLPPTFAHDLMTMHTQLDLPRSTKIGCALRIDDLPDTYAHACQVRAWERQFWGTPAHRVGARQVPVFQAAIDTTLALYPPGYSRHAFEAYRVAGPYTVRHLPWYYNLRRLPDNERYYRQRKLRNVGHWSSKA